jgi:hypothetical protein
VVGQALGGEEQLDDDLGLEELGLEVLPIPAVLHLLLQLVLTHSHYFGVDEFLALSLETVDLLLQLLVPQFEQDLALPQLGDLSKVLPAKGARRFSRLLRRDGRRSAVLLPVYCKLADNLAAIHLTVYF